MSFDNICAMEISSLCLTDSHTLKRAQLAFLYTTLPMYCGR